MADAPAGQSRVSGTVEVCYPAAPNQVEIVSVAASAGWTIRDAIEASGLLARHSIDLGRCRVGIFGKLKTLDAPARAGDRIEIYRPLTADPNTARLRRAEKNRK